MIGCFADDLCIVAQDEATVDAFLDRLKGQDLEFSKEDTLTEYLGIKLHRDQTQGTITLTQTGLIDKVVTTLGLTNCKPNRTPTTQLALGSDVAGEPMQEAWSYASAVGMLLYLSTNTGSDIAFAVSQVARFTSNPKQSHATAVKMIFRYLQGTRLHGTVLKPKPEWMLDEYVDADMAGLFHREPDELIESVQSRAGKMMLFAGCPMLWSSKLMPEIALSTLEAEYAALSAAIRVLLPLKRILFEAVAEMGLPQEVRSTVRARVFEDNQGAFFLATKQYITARTKYFLLKYHWFWSHFKNNEFEIFKVGMGEQLADYLMKGLKLEHFEVNRMAVQGW
jgi:hypothetical protein